jgi:hypothetical protein
MSTKKTTKKAKKTLAKIIDVVREEHQIGLMLLLIGDLAKAKPYFLQPYDSGTYRTSVFGVNGLNAAVFQAAQAAYDTSTSGGLQDLGDLVDTLQGFQAQMSIIGAQVQAQNDPYPPGDPCPSGDSVTLKVPSVMKLTA